MSVTIEVKFNVMQRKDVCHTLVESFSSVLLAFANLFRKSLLRVRVIILMARPTYQIKVFKEHGR